MINPSLVGASVAVVSWLMDGGMKRKRYCEGKDKDIQSLNITCFFKYTLQFNESSVSFNLTLI